MAAELDKDAVAKAYGRWAPVYDLVFGAVFERGRKASIAAAERIGGRILEVGVGTGLSLRGYSWTNRLIGVDLSAPMLRKAKARVAEHRLTNVEGLAVMDAQHLGFQDAVFDVVVAQYVITAVPDPEATLDEFARVVKPGGEIILVNHLGAESGRVHPSNDGSHRWRGGSAGGRSSAGSAWRNGRRGTAACASWSGALCRRLGISRSSALPGSTVARASISHRRAGRSGESKPLKAGWVPIPWHDAQERFFALGKDPELP
jgi:phosphatidylethanolamine/phosphatidyl-N-methylethanolamine N-methyltransferase